MLNALKIAESIDEFLGFRLMSNWVVHQILHAEIWVLGTLFLVTNDLEIHKETISCQCLDNAWGDTKLSSITEVSERFSRFLLGLPPGHLCSCNYTFGTWSKLVLWPWNCVMPLQNDLGIMSLDYALTHGPSSVPSCSQHSLWPWNSISDTEDDLVMTLRCCQWPSWPWEVLLSLIAPTWPYALPFYYDYIVNL